MDPVRLVEANSKVWQACWPEVEDKWALGAVEGASVSLEAWRRTLRACGCSDDSVAQLAFQTHSQLAREAYRLFDDVREFLTSAKRALIPLALITNGASDTQRDKLRALDIERWFDPVVISGEVGVAKPDASAFAAALNTLGVERQNVWHVGDSLTADVAGAKAAGLTVVWLNRKGDLRRKGDPEPDFEFRSLSDLSALLEG